jgi:aryl-alcohol dehydrogenase-like predicted oxidoreductase
MTFGTPVGEVEAVHIVHWALDNGVNFIDTANMYEGYTRVLGSAGGVAEEILGAALADRRDRAVLATKVGHPIGPEEGDKGLSRNHILRECERSLARLKTDWVDLYYMHAPCPDTPIQESIATFMELIDAGKVRHWGISNFDAAQTLEVFEACDAGGWTRPVVHQPAYSLLKREIETDLLPLCAREKVAVVPYQVLQGGLLTGKYANAQVPAGSRAAEKPEWLPLLQEEAVRQQIAALQDEAEERGLSLFDHVIRTTVDKQAVTSIILGVKRPEQLDAAIKALD